MKPYSSALMATVVLITMSGCASKSWVEQELDRRDARIDSNLAATQEATSVRIKRVADLAQQGLGAVDQRIGVLEARTAELQDGARGMALRAENATSRADGVDARLTRLWANRNARTVVNVLHVEFAFDQSALNDAAKSMLFVLVDELRSNPGLGLDLEGFTDSKGTLQYNVRLSQRRIDAVRRYLIDQGVERHRIRASARGPLESSDVPEERKRRVDIKLIVAAD